MDSENSTLNKFRTQEQWLKHKLKTTEKNFVNSINNVLSGSTDGLTKEETGVILNVSTKTVDRYVKQGLLSYFPKGKNVYIEPSRLHKFLLHGFKGY